MRSISLNCALLSFICAAACLLAQQGNATPSPSEQATQLADALRTTLIANIQSIEPLAKFVIEKV
jgi:hypothetical protein